MATPTFRQPADNDTPWQQRLANYASDRDAGRNEYKRALEVYQGKSALGDTAGANLAKQWADKVNTATGGYAAQQKSPYQEQIKPLIERMTQNANQQPFQFQAPQQFSYNPQTDPQYQAALRQAQQNAQTAGNNAMVQMGSRGIGNSSMTTDRVAQIQQSELGRVSDTVLPQLMQQAYQRYADDANRDWQRQLANYQAAQDNQNRLSELVPLLSGLDQQDWQRGITEAGLTGRYNGQNTMQQRQMNIDNANTLAQLYGTYVGPKDDGNVLFDQVRDMAPINSQQFQYQQYRDAIADERYKQQFDEDARRHGLDYALRQAQLANQIDMSRAGLALDQARFGLDQDRFRSSIDMEIYDRMNQPSAAGPTAGDISRIINSSPIMQRLQEQANLGVDVYSDPNVQRQIEAMIISQTQNPQTAVQLYNLYGIPVPSGLQKEYNDSLK
ncbi:hypothetical protein [Paenibacillus senegalensis]|uniref:hypothetical protein n=1 Tax=Paenibacillus senegalensis TaxID=1465766 RepID=UPI0002FB8554|nr:hypothetical protein [Paenibacillus senegalensis]